ncbi:MAG: 3-hydroxyacyl-ACP dehydratase FabZ [Bdellovibrionota bacterium]
MRPLTPNKYCLGIDQIQRFLPHKQPFLLIDKILEIHPAARARDLTPQNQVGTKVVALKCVSYNEPYFQGHFPGFAILPGVLVVEAMAQTASFSLYVHMEHELDRPASPLQCVLVGVDHARFRKPVVPGDRLRIETVVSKCRGRLWAFTCNATVEDQLVAEAEILANLIQGPQSD